MIVVVLMTTKSSSAVLPISQMPICMDAMIKHPAQAIPLPLTAGAAVQNRYKILTVLTLIILIGKMAELYLQLQKEQIKTLPIPKLTLTALQVAVKLPLVIP